MMAANPPNPELAALPDLFLLNEKNRAFVEGRRQHIDVEWGWNRKDRLLSIGVLGLGFVTMLLISLILVNSGSFNFNTLAAASFLVIAGCPIAFASVLHERRRRHLAQEGQLIRGMTIASILEEEHGEASGYMIGVHYVFQTREGRQLSDIVKRRMRTLQEAAKNLPNKGTPLAVLYVNDSLYEVL